SELLKRGHRVWGADVPDIWAESSQSFACAAEFRVSEKPRLRLSAEIGPVPTLSLSAPSIAYLEDFNLIVIRKEPPFDAAYYYLTLLLDRISHKVAVSNRASGIRNTNEKMATLLFPDFIPPTIVSSNISAILEFQRSRRCPLIVKPLNEKGGTGIILLPYKHAKHSNLIQHLKRMTQGGHTPVLAQVFLRSESRKGDKRLLVLDGKILAGYQKKPPRNDFRSNLSIGGTFHEARITPHDEKLAAAMKPYLHDQGIHFTGLDVMAGKLLDFNVTCPAGLTEAKVLYPRLGLVEAWVDFLERLQPS
ncbi:MAG: hypothetical protein A2Z83_02295, partial [Omnitrophica bacterium GWA2_52_8]